MENAFFRYLTALQAQLPLVISQTQGYNLFPGCLTQKNIIDFR